MKLKHNEIVEDLERRLRRLHPDDLILVEEEYDVYGIHGEVDDALVRPTTTYLIEVKTNDTFKAFNKACIQLCKDKNWVKSHYYSDKYLCFYAYNDPSMRRGYDVVKLDL